MAIFGQSLVNRARDVTCRSCPSLDFVLARESGGAHALPAADNAVAAAAAADLREKGGGEREREGGRGVLLRQRKKAENRNRRRLNEPRLSKQEIKARSGAWKGDQLSS